MKIELGLCDPPEPTYLYVGNGEFQGQQYLWYCFDINSERVHPVFQRGLTGYIRELRVTPKEYKGKDATKLDVVLSCDRLYIVRSGIETNFSKGLLLALSQINDFENPLTIVVAPGEETVIFARLYIATTGERVKTEWNPNAPWLDLIQAINQKLGVSPPSRETPPSPKTNNVVNLRAYPEHNRLVKHVRGITGHQPDAIINWCRGQGVTLPSELPPQKTYELLNSLIAGWLQEKKGMTTEAAVKELQAKLTYLTVNQSIDRLEACAIAADELQQLQSVLKN